MIRYADDAHWPGAIRRRRRDDQCRSAIGDDEITLHALHRRRQATIWRRDAVS